MLLNHSRMVASGLIGLLTLNPCIDKTIFVESLPSHPGTIDVQKVHLQAGGKGNNVARVLKRLGTASVSLNLVSGSTGEVVCDLLSAEGLTCDFFSSAGRTRTITTIVDKDYRQLVFKEPVHLPDTVKPSSILKWVTEKLDQFSVLCINGSMPRSDFATFPQDLIQIAKQHQIPVLLDTSGSALLNGLKAGPTYCKPNIQEISSVFSGSPVTLLSQLSSCGVQYPIITLNEQGAVYLYQNQVIQIKPPAVQTINSVGCGDSFIAGLLHASSHGADLPESIRFATACGAANATSWEIAEFENETVSSLIPMVRESILCHSAVQE